MILIIKFDINYLLQLDSATEAIGKCITIEDAYSAAI